jgi:hypothetical protein
MQIPQAAGQLPGIPWVAFFIIWNNWFPAALTCEFCANMLEQIPDPIISDCRYATSHSTWRHQIARRATNNDG